MSDKNGSEEEVVDIRNPNGIYEEGSVEHEHYLKTTPNPKDPRRNLKGHYLKGFSGNDKGKGRNIKSKVSTQRLAGFFRNNGVKALEMAMDIAEKSMLKGDNNTALRASMFVGGEMIKFAMNQEKNEMTLQVTKARSGETPKGGKNNTHLEDEDQDDDETPIIQEVVFKRSKASGE